MPGRLGHSSLRCGAFPCSDCLCCPAQALGTGLQRSPHADSAAASRGPWSSAVVRSLSCSRAGGISPDGGWNACPSHWHGAKSPQLCLTLCYQMDCSQPTPAPKAPRPRGLSRREHWRGRLFPPPGDLPAQASAGVSALFSTAGGGVFATCATWGRQLSSVPPGKSLRHLKAVL